MTAVNSSARKTTRSVPVAGVWLAISAALLFSLKPVLIKLIYTYEVDSVVLLTWRMIISAPIYLGIGWALWRKSEIVQRTGWRRDALKAAALGFVGYYLAALFDLKGLETVSAQFERVVLFTYPALVSLLAWLIYRRPISRRMWGALLLSYVGVVILFVEDWQSLGDSALVGTVWVLLAALSFALYVLLSKSIIDKMGSQMFTVVAMLASTVYVLTQFALLRDFADLHVPAPAMMYIVLMALVSTVIPSFLIAAAIARIGAEKTALTGTLGPIATALFAVVLLDEAFGWRHAVALALVLSAVWVMREKRVARPN